MSDQSKHRTMVFVLFCVVCVAATVVFGFMRRPVSSPKEARTDSPPAPASVLEARPQASEQPGNKTGTAPAPGREAGSPPQLLYYRANSLGANYGKLAVANLDAPDRPRYSPELLCDRVHFSHGVGMCLASERGVFTTYSAVQFDEHLKRGWSIPLNGQPSRTRVSPSGRLAAITVFISGHSYASLDLSTQTLIVNTANGAILADLEQFAVTRDGAPFQSPDFNFWGVTFQKDENRFYATLWTKSRSYLVECDLSKRTARVIREDVECPSLSPDGTRIAFKKRIGTPRFIWRIHLLDLTTMSEIPLGEERSVDDQVLWFDNGHVLYALSQNEKGASASTDIWMLPATADGVPHILLSGAFSPAVVSAGPGR
jgi:hypothetical protein